MNAPVLGRPSLRQRTRALERAAAGFDESQPARFDDVIVGAGCAGLSLACQLSQQPGERSVLLVEPRERYVRDRTWCYWDVDPQPHPFTDCVSHSWSRWAVRLGGRTLVHESPGLHYRHIPADAFYAAAQRRLGEDPRFSLWLGERALGLRPGPGAERVELLTGRGGVIGERLFDSRPTRQPRQGRHVQWVQHFVGWRIKTARPAFDPETVTLMDFDVPQVRGEGVHFLYVLPYGPDEALVEATWFGPSALHPERYRRAIEGYLSQRYGLDPGHYELLERERGAIPMSTAPRRARSGRRVYRLGTGGGLVKPSTGYAFLAIQRHSRRLAERLARRRLPRPPAARGALWAALDRIFLAYLARHPEQGPELFFRMFERVEPQAVARFLSERAGPGEIFQVLRAMPTAGFAWEAVRSWRTWLAP